MRFVPGGIEATAGTRVIIPDGRRGALAKWPTITEDGLVRIDLDVGGCYVCRVADLELEAQFSPQYPSTGRSPRAGGQMAEFEPE